MRKTFFVLLIVTVLLVASQVGVPAAQAYGPTYHVVLPGQTLFSIASMYGLSTWAVAYANGLWNPNYIYSGQTLVIPNAGYTGYGRYYYNPAYNQCNGPYGGYAGCSNVGYYPRQSYGGCYYWVRWGDTMYGIAWKFGGNAYTIASANGIADINWIYAGQRLFIPGCN